MGSNLYPSVTSRPFNAPLISAESLYRIAVAFDKAQEIMGSRALNPFWKWTEKFSTEGQEMKNACTVLDEFAYDVIDKRELEQKGDITHSRTDLLNLYLSIRDDNGQPLSRTALRDAILSLIVAGRCVCILLLAIFLTLL